MLFAMAFPGLGEDSGSVPLRARPITMASWTSHPDGAATDSEPGFAMTFLAEGQNLIEVKEKSLVLDFLRTPDGRDLSNNAAGQPNWKFPCLRGCDVSADGKYCSISLEFEGDQFGRVESLAVQGSVRAVVGERLEERHVELDLGDTTEKNVGPFTLQVVERFRESHEEIMNCRHMQSSGRGFSLGQGTGSLHRFLSKVLDILPWDRLLSFVPGVFVVPAYTKQKDDVDQRPNGEPAVSHPKSQEDEELVLERHVVLANDSCAFWPEQPPEPEPEQTVFLLTGPEDHVHSLEANGQPCEARSCRNRDESCRPYSVIKPASGKLNVTLKYWTELKEVTILFGQNSEAGESQ
jgi:hypothetical protein